MSKELEPRNQAMYQLYAAGKSMQTIADTFGITRQRAAQIIARYAADGVANDDESRALHRAQLEGMMTESLAMFYEPAPPAYSATGALVRDENGEPVRDIQGKIHAGTLALKISGEIRRMDAIDKPRRKQLPENEAMAQMKEWLSKLPKAEVIEDHPEPLQAVVLDPVLDQPADPEDRSARTQDDGQRHHTIEREHVRQVQPSEQHTGNDGDSQPEDQDQEP